MQWLEFTRLSHPKAVVNEIAPELGIEIGAAAGLLPLVTLVGRRQNTAAGKGVHVVVL